jgi:hypothetical protein
MSDVISIRCVLNDGRCLLLVLLFPSVFSAAAAVLLLLDPGSVISIRDSSLKSVPDFASRFPCGCRTST